MSVDYFDLKLEETVSTPKGSYVQKYRDGGESYAVMYREGRFGEPSEVFENLQEADADQLMLAAETGRVEEILQGGRI